MAVKLVSSTKIYLDARKLLDIILDIVPNFPRAYKFTIGAKLQEIGVNLMQEIAAAYINKDKADRKLLDGMLAKSDKARYVLWTVGYYYAVRAFGWLFFNYKDKKNE